MAILDDILGGYKEIELARIQRDTAKYTHAAETQRAALHSPEAVSATAAVNVGNTNATPQTVGGYIDRIPKGLLWGSVALLVGGLALKAFK